MKRPGVLKVCIVVGCLVPCCIFVWYLLYNPPLFAVIADGNARRLEKLLRRKPSLVLERWEHRETPLHVAACTAPGVTRVLLEHGADPNATNDSGRTPLHVAAEYGRLEAAKLLIDAGADVGLPTGGGWTPLHCAAVFAGPAIAEVLLARGALVDAQDEDGWTPLHYAANGASFETVRVLLDGGADLSVKNANGEEPLDLVPEWANDEMQRTLQRSVRLRPEAKQSDG